MKGDKLGEIRRRKPFAVWDLLVYGILAALIAAGFLWLALTGDDSPLEGIRVTCYGETIYTCTFAGESTRAEDWQEAIGETREGDLLVVTFTFSDGGRSVLELDCAQRTARMREADCSRHHDCTRMRAISAADGVIVCVPRGLKVTALGSEGAVSPPVLG